MAAVKNCISLCDNVINEKKPKSKIKLATTKRAAAIKNVFFFVSANFSGEKNIDCIAIVWTIMHSADYVNTILNEIWNYDVKMH